MYFHFVTEIFVTVIKDATQDAHISVIIAVVN